MSTWNDEKRKRLLSNSQTLETNVNQIIGINWLPQQKENAHMKIKQNKQFM